MKEGKSGQLLRGLTLGLKQRKSHFKCFAVWKTGKWGKVVDFEEF